MKVRDAWKLYAKQQRQPTLAELDNRYRTQNEDNTMKKQIKELEKELQLAKDALQTVECGISELKNDEPVEEVQAGQYWQWKDSNSGVIRIDHLNGCTVCFRPIADNADDICGRSYLVNNARKLSTDEIEQALDQERKRRGFKKDTYHDARPLGWDQPKNYITGNGIKYYPDKDILKMNGWEIYKQGNWAEIIDQPIEINGKQIDVEGGTVKISCGDTIEEDMFKNFYAVVNKYDLDVSRNGEHINEQLQQIWDAMPQKLAGKPVEWTIEVSGEANSCGRMWL